MRGLVHRIVFVFFCSSANWEARAHWAFEQTRSVPIDRVMTNFQARLAKDPKSVAVLYQLARTHSMSYSPTFTAVDVTTNEQGQIKELIFDYPGSDGFAQEYRPLYQFARASRRKTAFNERHLLLSTGRANLVLKGTKCHRTPMAYLADSPRDSPGASNKTEIPTVPSRPIAKALQLAWQMEIEPTPTFKGTTRLVLDKIRAKQSPFSKHPRNLGPGVCFSDEIIGTC